MSYGIIEYDKEGKPKCEICAKHYNRVTSHVRQAHNISAREYKLKFGFDLNKGIISKASKKKSSDAVHRNFDLVVTKNLVVKGNKTRFKHGSKGRTKDQVSEQTRLMLNERLKTPTMIEAMKKSGRKVGKSCLGNKKRWT